MYNGKYFITPIFFVKWREIEFSSQLNRLLEAGEKVLWSGKPVKVPFMFPGLRIIPFGLFFMGFSIIWMWVASQAPGFFWLFGLIFFFIGFAVSFGAPIRQLMAYKNTEYMITNRRIITQTGAIGLETRFLDLDKIQEVYVQISFLDRMFGTGTLFAVTAGYIYSDRYGASMRPSFAALKEPYEVQKILQEAIRRKTMA